jgi:hypothetical protein
MLLDKVRKSVLMGTATQRRLMAVTLKSGSDGGRLDAMEARVKILENDMGEIKTDLKMLLLGFAEIKGAFRSMASAEALVDLKGTVGELRGTMASKEALGELRAAVSEMKGTMASAEALAALKGRADSLPTMANLSSVIGVATAVIVILNNWSVIKDWLVH